ncbi:hypothetical protein FV139_00425 [Parahaliea maris]|uniref:Lipoprotein n=1 Tax=Parahaliea maris TaxID=2716870 RepID=A0A5C9A7D0_9GAMM|nr:hypothetical protein [Parahaliea maris]TXS96009.1 hypothetical protein FV139_00425 [Parahaliea maris]
MKRPSAKLIALLLTTGLASGLATAARAVDAEENLPEAWFAQQGTMEKLREETGVRPPKPDQHPVAAMYNREAIIPPQCYTRTEGKHNPCYVCHQDALPGRENVMNDRDLQEAYSFSDLGQTNHWANLFRDRAQRVAGISDREILDWVDDDNYSDLQPRLQAAGFKGWIPDLENLEERADAFDEQGIARDGSGWVAFNYKPFPSTFWPTNGSTDDVMIRLPAIYREDAKGEPSRAVYQANLAILEANIKELGSITTAPLDERELGVDLNGDGALAVITEITDVSRYVGAAREQYLEPFLYPKGTEFLHTVRYLGMDDEGRIGVSRRMKEVRYMKKWQAYNKPTLARYYEEEAFEKEAGFLPGYTRLGDWGLDNGSGWSIQGFIENREGKLRVATHEENTFCMGCHSSIGSTIDKTFSFARKIDGAAGWGYINLKGMPDAPNVGEFEGEFLTYFRRAGGGDEFRSNPEVLQRFFDENGKVDADKVAGLDVYDLIVPSAVRALQLNKAYRVIVDEQSFLFGRDATWHPPMNVYDAVSNVDSPTLEETRIFDWDIRLDWQAANASGEGRSKTVIAVSQDAH